VAIVGGMLAFASPQPKFLGGRVPPVPPIIAAPDSEPNVKPSLVSNPSFIPNLNSLLNPSS